MINFSQKCKSLLFFTALGIAISLFTNFIRNRKPNKKDGEKKVTTLKEEEPDLKKINEEDSLSKNDQFIKEQEIKNIEPVAAFKDPSFKTTPHSPFNTTPSSLSLTKKTTKTLPSNPSSPTTVPSTPPGTPVNSSLPLSTDDFTFETTSNLFNDSLFDTSSFEKSRGQMDHIEDNLTRVKLELDSMVLSLQHVSTPNDRGNFYHSITTIFPHSSASTPNYNTTNNSTHNNSTHNNSTHNSSSHNSTEDMMNLDDLSNVNFFDESWPHLSKATVTSCRAEDEGMPSESVLRRIEEWDLDETPLNSPKLCIPPSRTCLSESNLHPPSQHSTHPTKHHTSSLSDVNLMPNNHSFNNQFSVNLPTTNH